MKTTYSAPISVKGIVFEAGSIWLRKNERDEWELPGGKLDHGEQPEQTVVRELQEELGFDVRPVRVEQAFLYTITKSLDEADGVLVLSYLCELQGKTGAFEHNGEAGRAEFRAISIAEVPHLRMPEFYKNAILGAMRSGPQALSG